MANLLVQSAQMSLPINLSALGTMTLSDQQFYDFCQTNPELRIERNASGEIIVMPPVRQYCLLSLEFHEASVGLKLKVSFLSSMILSLWLLLRAHL